MQSLGRYELVQVLGQGGMGEVYLAKISGAAGFEKPCIVKTLLPSLTDQQFLDRFHHEAKVLVHLVHSNIAQVYDMGEANGTYYIALEYVAGVDLSHVQDQARQQGTYLPVPIAIYFGQKISEGLGYAHRKTGPDGAPLGIVHRDVSPQNVMVSYEGEVKVIDFGLAKSAARSKHTLPSTVMGKLGYMSPEQARAEPVDHRSDVYSCGVVVWEMLAGRPMIPHGTMGEMMAFMTQPRVPSLTGLRGDVDPALETIVRRALAPSPDERYPRADDFARALNEQLLRSGSTVGPEEAGNFVRGLCPEAYAAQRKLISKLTTIGVRKSPLPPLPGTPSTEVTPVRDHVEGAPDEIDFAATAVRLGGVATPAPVTPAPPSQVTLPPMSQKSAVRALLAVAAIVAATAGVTAVVRGSRDPPPAPAPPAPVAEPLKPAPEVVARAEPPAPPEAPPPSEGPEPDRAAPREKKKRKRSTAEEPLVSVKAMAEMFNDRGAHYVRAGSAAGITVGSELNVVGPARDSKRPLLGEATVLEVWPKLSRVSLERSVRDAMGKKFAALPEAPSARPEVATEVPKPPDPIVQPVVAQTPTPPAPEAPAKPRALMGRATISGFGPLRAITVYNADKMTWNRCDAIIQGKKKHHLGALAPGGRREISLFKFELDHSVRFIGTNQIGLTCAEGLGDFAVRF